MTGAVVVDTNVFVTARNPRESGHAACRVLLARVDAGDLDAIVSAITLAELRAGFDAAQAVLAWQPILSHLRTSPNYTVAPVDADVAETAGVLRSTTQLSLPDAIIAATGILAQATAVITRDKELLRARLPISVRPP